MSTVRHIRQIIFNLTQREFAIVAGVTQPTVSRWEAGTALSQGEMHSIRQAAVDRGIKWNDRWFFEVPQHAQIEPDRLENHGNSAAPAFRSASAEVSR